MAVTQLQRLERAQPQLRGILNGRWFSVSVFQSCAGILGAR